MLGKCREYGVLPSALLEESTELLHYEAIVSAGKAYA